MEFLKAMSDVGVSRAFQWTEEYADGGYERTDG